LEKYRQAEQQQVARSVDEIHAERVAISKIKNKQNQKNRKRVFPILLI
jgi:hypothetical protein